MSNTPVIDGIVRKVVNPYHDASVQGLLLPGRKQNLAWYVHPTTLERMEIEARTSWPPVGPNYPTIADQQPSQNTIFGLPVRTWKALSPSYEKDGEWHAGSVELRWSVIA